MPFRTKSQAIAHVNFVRSQGTYNSTVLKEASRKKHFPESELVGKSVRCFYEDLVGINVRNDTVSVSDAKPPASGSYLDAACKRRKTETSRTTQMASVKDRTSVGGNDVERQRRENRFLQSAQDGDLRRLRDTMDAGVDMDAADRYGWTAVMCASHAGHERVVRCLLDAGANTVLCDREGRTAVGIALLAKQRHVVKLLRDRHRGNRPTPPPPPAATSYCATCDCDLKESSSSSKRHTASTVHLLNCKMTPKSTTYLIPESNRGFQMMLRSGWDREKGLGSEGQGKKWPVKTVLKKDRQCLGNKVREKPKVTHFGPHDDRSVRDLKTRQNSRLMKVSTLESNTRSQKISKQKAMERNFRMQFNME